MTARRPSHVRVGPVKYKIAIGKEFDAVLDSRDRAGEYHGVEQELLVHTKNAPDQQVETVVHETLHAITQANGTMDRLGDKKEEFVVSQMAPWLVMLIRDNPQLIAWIQGKDSPQ